MSARCRVVNLRVNAESAWVWSDSHDCRLGLPWTVIGDRAATPAQMVHGVVKRISTRAKASMPLLASAVALSSAHQQRSLSDPKYRVRKNDPGLTVGPRDRQRSLTARCADLSANPVTGVEAAHPRGHDLQGELGVADMDMVLGVLGLGEDPDGDGSGRGERVELACQLSCRYVVIV
jgi:hypothetical protein